MVMRLPGVGWYKRESLYTQVMVPASGPDDHTKEHSVWKAELYWWDPMIGALTIPNFTGGMTEAHLVVEKLREDGYAWSAKTHEDGFEVVFENTEFRGFATALTLPEATCLAALTLPHPEVRPMKGSKNDEKAEIDVEVRRRGTAALLVSDGGDEGWVPFSLIDDESEITASSDVGDEGILIIPQWKAEELGLV